MTRSAPGSDSSPPHFRPAETTAVGMGGGVAGMIAAGKGTFALAATKAGISAGLGKGLVAGLGLAAMAASPVGIGLTVGAMASLLHAAHACRAR